MASHARGEEGGREEVIGFPWCESLVLNLVGVIMGQINRSNRIFTAILGASIIQSCQLSLHHSTT